MLIVGFLANRPLIQYNKQRLTPVGNQFLFLTKSKYRRLARHLSPLVIAYFKRSRCQGTLKEQI